MPLLMFKSLKSIIVAAMLVTLSACSWLVGDDGIFRDREQDYRKATLDSPLKIPANLDSSAIVDSFPIPPVDDQLALRGEFDVPRPESLDDAASEDFVRLQKLGDKQWILIEASPGQVWTQLRGFLSVARIPLARIDTEQGVIESAWFEPATEGVLKERYRFVIDQGIQRETAEVYITQADIRAGEDNWPRKSSNAEREQEVLQALAQHIADTGAAVAVSMMAQKGIDSSGKVMIRLDESEQPYLELRVQFLRAWASLHTAMLKAGFTVEDLNRDQQLIYASYLPKNVEEPGFFASLFGAEAQQAIAYIVKLEQVADSQANVTVSRQDGEALQAGEAEQVLKLIKRHLS